jgi:BlaI family transcriptional regulator, penicillinase repressor
MAVVWRRAPVPASAIVEEMGESKQWTLATVRTFLRRLVTKGALAQRLDGKRYLYAPLVSWETCVQRESDLFWDRVARFAPSAAILRLLQRMNLSPQEIREVRCLFRSSYQQKRLCVRDLEINNLRRTADAHRVCGPDRF